MNTVKKFDFDKWVEVQASSLVEGDIIIYQSTTVLVTNISMTGKQRNINVEPFGDGPIKIQLGDPDFRYVGAAMDYVGSGCEEFSDGTALITEISAGNTYIFSPRLPRKELNDFCKNYLEKYEAHFKVNERELDAGRMVYMSPFWL